MSDAYNTDNNDFDAYFRSQGLILNPEGTEYIKPPVDPEEEEKKKKLIELLAQQTLTEEATTGQPAGTRQILSEIQRSEDATTPDVTPIEPQFDPAPVQTIDEIQQTAGPDPGQVQQLLGRPQIDPEPLLSTVDKLKALGQQAVEPVRQAGRGLVSAITATPNDLLAALATPVAAVTERYGIEGPSRMREGFMQTAARNRENARALFGAKEKGNPIEELARLAGESVTPIKGAGILKPTAVIAGSQFGVDQLLTPALAAKAKQSKEDKAAEKQAQLEADATHIVEAIGGPVKVKSSELWTLGGMAAVSIGAIFGPMLYAKFKRGYVPHIRPVEDAKPGTIDISKNTDLARTYDDANAGALRLMRRAGVDPVAAKEVQKTFDIQTRSAANTLTEAAVNLGRMETPGFTFQSKVPLAKLALLDAPDVRSYLFLRHTLDELLVAGTKQSPNKAIAFGPPVVNGLTSTQALQQISALEKSNPNLKAVSDGYRDILRSQRKFEAMGEYATVSRKKAAQLHSEQSNLVPYTKAENSTKQNPFQAMSDTMRDKLRHRMENEAVGKYVDEVRKTMPNAFVRVTSAEIEKNPHWQKNVVTIHRRGKVEYYTTAPYLADILKLDPYFSTGMLAGAANITRNAFQQATTGKLAPWFAPVAGLRAWQQAKLTRPEGSRSPTLVGSALAIPQQLYPQMAKAISEKLNVGSLGWVEKVLGPATTNAMSLRLAKAYDDSLFARMQTAGSFQGGTYLNDYMQATKAAHSAIASVKGPTRAILDGYLATLDAAHNAPAFNFAKRNEKKYSINELAQKARDLTGDPRVGGQYYTGQGRPIRMEGTNRVTHTATRAYGAVTEFGRNAVPWYNTITQSTKAVGRSYMANPAGFVGRAWLYGSAPAATQYFFARALGNDPLGRSYVDYMMNERSDTDRILNWYIPIPGKPAEQGIKIPMFQELTIVPYLTMTALDHLSRSAVFTESQDFMRAAAAYAGVVLNPPLPAAGNALLASQGMTGLYGTFGDESRKQREDPYDQSGGMPHSLELMGRALTPGIADIVGSFASAYWQTEEGYLKATQNGFKSAGNRMVDKAPVFRDLLGTTPVMGGATRVSDEMFKKKKTIDALVAFDRSSDELSDKTGRSISGGVVADKLLGPPVPRKIAGYTPNEPTNPLFKLFAEEVSTKLKNDAIRDRGGALTGAVGYQSIWKRYADATAQIRSLSKINAGNNVTYLRKMESDEGTEQRDYLTENKVNYKDYVAVRNWYEHVRQDAARAILFTIHHVEDEFSKRLGTPIKIEDLDPYGKGNFQGQMELNTRNY